MQIFENIEALSDSHRTFVTKNLFSQIEAKASTSTSTKIVTIKMRPSEAYKKKFDWMLERVNVANVLQARTGWENAVVLEEA